MAVGDLLMVIQMQGATINITDAVANGTVTALMGVLDTDHDGFQDASETDPNKVDADGDGVQDGTEQGLAQPQSPDTDRAVFIANGDPRHTQTRSKRTVTPMGSRMERRT